MIYGYQAVYDSSFYDAIEYAASHQFDYVSFDLNVPRFYIDQIDPQELNRIRDFAEQKQVGLAFHLPGDNISLFSDYPSIRRGILDHFSASIQAAEYLGARHIAVHTGIYPAFKQVNQAEDPFVNEYQDYFSQVLTENLLHLANQTRHTLLCVENYQFTPLTMNAVGRLLSDCERIFLTWDIAKTYNRQVQLDTEIEDFMWKHSARIREVHAHDIIKNFRSHQIVGEGDIDFTRYLELLKRPEVAVTFEVRPREAALLSRERLEALL